MMDPEQFIANLKKQAISSTGYYPPNAGEIEPQVLEQAAEYLQADLRVKSVEPKYSGKTLKQLWVVLEDDEYQGS
jgi:hypothetical protein